MNTRQKTRTAIALGAALLAAGATAASAQALGSGAQTTGTGAQATPTLAQSLQTMREEERMARDLYRAFADTHDGALPFAAIAASEQRHFDAVGTLLDRYDVTDPSAGKSAGTYADAEIQKLYNTWLAEGKASLAKAYAVGVDLEKADIGDLKDAISAVSAADVKQVYTRLMNASEHHLDAFEAAPSGNLVPGTMGRGGMGQAGRVNPGPGYGSQGMGGNGMGGQGTGTCPYTAPTS